MKLSTQVRLFRSTSWVLAAICFLPIACFSLVIGFPLFASAVVSTILFVATAQFVPGMLVRSAFRRLRGLIASENLVEARALLAELVIVYAGSHGALERLRITEAGLLSLEQRYAEACSLLESLDRRWVGAGAEPWIVNNLAWTMAHSGRVSEGLAMARASMVADDPKNNRLAFEEDLRAYKLGTLGSILVLAGEASEGVSLLEQALARGGRPSAQAARAFYLGEGLRALGRDEDAAKAYARAQEAAPKNAFAKRAETRVAELRPYR
jgi:tetratricopeptide (TPR) repeat protein